MNARRLSESGISPALQARVRALAEGLTYRDGWSFRFFYPATIEVEWLVPDVEVPAAVTILRGGVTARGWFDDDDLMRRLLLDLWQLVSDLESHERLELLQLRGRPLWNPHPDGSRGERLMSAPAWPVELPEGV